MTRSDRNNGLTLIETMVSVAILGVLLAIAVPSATEWIIRERVKASAAEMAGDVQFARAEAIRRNAEVQITFRSNTSEVCYTIQTVNSLGLCDCRLQAGNACPTSPNRFELKTASFPRSASVAMTYNQNLRFDYVRALPTTANPLQVNFDGGSHRQLRVETNATGRARVCTPSGSSITGYPDCE